MNTQTLPEGTIKRLHVNQFVIKRNLKENRDEPALTVQTSQGPIRAKRVKINGPSELVQMMDKPLSCGARIWIQTSAEVVVES